MGKKGEKGWERPKDKLWKGKQVLFLILHPLCCLCKYKPCDKYNLVGHICTFSEHLKPPPVVGGVCVAKSFDFSVILI